MPARQPLELVRLNSKVIHLVKALYWLEMMITGGINQFGLKWNFVPLHQDRAALPHFLLET